MADLRKHRREKEYYEHDFAAELSEGEALSGTPTVAVLLQTQGAWVDVTDEFGGDSISPAISGTTVTYTLLAASASQQDGGNYVLRIEVDTDAGRHLVALVEDLRKGGEFRLPTLRVIEQGDPDAP